LPVSSHLLDIYKFPNECIDPVYNVVKVIY